MVVIDMKMPKDCAECKCCVESFDGSFVCCLGVSHINWNERPDDCPLKEVNNKNIGE